MIEHFRSGDFTSPSWQAKPAATRRQVLTPLPALEAKAGMKDEYQSKSK